ncbi:MAG: HD domain-containing protein [Acidimicrobiales bacterium]
MAGHRTTGGTRTAHADSRAEVGNPTGPGGPESDRPASGGRADGSVLTRAAREGFEEALLAPGATRSEGAGRRRIEEQPDEWRTCFERDRDRILHSTSFRRLAGKTQVFIFPEDHQRTRLTHALEVAQVATSIASALRLNVTLAEAIALGHDCGHGPAGHASEDALACFLPEGFDHAVWGADVSLAGLNLCEETVDGIRNHSWSRPAPSTPEGEVVSWADRIAYVCHDWEDACSTGIVTPDMLPLEVEKRCGSDRSKQLGAFIQGVVAATAATGRVCMDGDLAEALEAFRRFDYERIYLRPASVAQGIAVVEVLRGLVEHFADRPNAIPAVRESGVPAGSDQALRTAVAYVAGMTDRFAMATAITELGWDPDRLPRGVEDWRRR